MKSILTILLAATAISASAQFPYKAIVPIPGIPDGNYAFMMNFDNGEVIDSVAIDDGAAVFKGELDEPYVVQVRADGKRFGTFILEQGTLAVNQTMRRAVGSMLNDRYNEYGDSAQALENAFENAATKEERERIMNDYIALTKQTILDNLDSPLGYLLFIDYANMVEPLEMTEFVNQHPDLKEYKRVQKLMASAEKKLATSAGGKFVDFEATYDGKTQKLSDYVGNGKYTLVDFWASWCGPCIQEIKVLKEIYNGYADKGLQVLGVAVWDEPQNTLAAMKRLNIPWDVILNTQNVATDAYGIPAIPCIILFGPDGTIISRDARGNELKAIVAETMQQ